MALWTDYALEGALEGEGMDTPNFPGAVGFQGVKAATFSDPTSRSPSGWIWNTARVQCSFLWPGMY